jgi:hypothetical protein
MKARRRLTQSRKRFLKWKLGEDVVVEWAPPDELVQKV